MPEAELSRIEERVLRLVASSRSTSEIAAALGLDAETVAEIKTAAMQKARLATQPIRSRSLRAVLTM